MTTVMRSTAAHALTLARFTRDWVIPALILILIATADGVVRTIALVAFGLVVAARLLIVASEALKRHAPQPRSRARARRQGRSA